jgi:hypothetical protein
MAYSLPELVLVGAAQNLVLVTSGSAFVKEIECTPGANDQDLTGIEEYNAIATW